MVIGDRILKLYEFKTIEDYYNYIVDSKILGNFSQMKDLFKRLSSEQKRNFIKWLSLNEIEHIKMGDLF